MNMNDQLKRAKENLEQLRIDYKNEPELLAIYEPSAIYVVEIIESNLK